MSDSKEHADASNALSFLHNPPPILCSENEEKVYHTRVQSDFSHFNDSNSDDTQFEIQSGELNSNHTSPSKEKTILEPIRQNDKPEHTNKYIKQECEPCDQDFVSVDEKTLQPEKPNSLCTTDAASFVDYFLANDDLLQALDDYSRSVGQTSVFPLAPSGSADIQPHHEKYCISKDLCNPSPSLQRASSIQRDSVVMNSSQYHAQTRKEGLPQEENCEKGSENLKQTRGKGRLGSKQASSTKAPRRSEKRKPRTYSQAIPSQHCHICSRRPTETSPHAVCGNLLKGRCRKTICTKCFHQFRWDLKAAREAPPGTWECPHCRGECPQRAQCVIYNRTSDRRRMKLINHRKKKDQTKTSAARKHEVNAKASEKESVGDSPNSGTTTTNVFVAPKSCSPSRTAALPTHPSSGISKPVRGSGMSSYAHLAYLTDEINHKIVADGQGRNEWEGAGIVSSSEMTQLELLPTQVTTAKGAGFEQAPLEMKNGEFLEDKGLEDDGQNGSGDVTGIFGMGFASPVLNDSTDNHETGIGMMVGTGNDGLDRNLGLLDIEKPFEGSKEGQENDQGRLSFWDEDEGKYEEIHVPEEEFTFNDNGLDLDAIV